MNPDEIDGTIQALSAPAFRILVVAVAALILLRLGTGVLNRLIARRLERLAQTSPDARLGQADLERRVATLTSLVEWALRLLIVVLAALLLLIALDLTPVITAIALVAAVVLFAGQEVIRDYVAGVLIVLENQFAVGDYVTIAEQDGDVESFSLRRTVLRSDQGDLISVPNGEIRVARNWTRTWARMHLEISIADPTRVGDALDAVKAAGEAMVADTALHGEVLEPPRDFGVTSFDDTGVRILVRGRIRAADRLETEGRYRRHLLDAFLARGLNPTLSRRVSLVEGSPASASAPSSETDAAGDGSTARSPRSPSRPRGTTRH